MSHDPSDCFEHGKQSSCCGARIMLGDICAECKEHCDAAPTDSEDREFTPEQQAIISRMEEAAKEGQP